MMDAFLMLPDDRRRARCEEAGRELGLSAGSVEQDFWVCWTLTRRDAWREARALAAQGRQGFPWTYALSIRTRLHPQRRLLRPTASHSARARGGLVLRSIPVES